jgi:hypothetical protein
MQRSLNDCVLLGMDCTADLVHRSRVDMLLIPDTPDIEAVLEISMMRLSLTITAPTLFRRQVDLVATTSAMFMKYSSIVGLMWFRVVDF